MSRGSLFLALSLLTAAVVQGQDGKLVGRWYGVLDLSNGQSLRMGLEVDERADGSIGADLISLDQGADGVPSILVEYGDPMVRIEFRPPHAVVVGQLSIDGQVLDARFVQGTFSAPLMFQRVDRLPGLVPRWQNPSRPYPYSDVETRFDGGAPGVTLAGTVTLPPTEGPHPAVVLVTGSGPQGRDELIAYHRPFLVLADFFTRRGIATLRYDDRGVGASTGDFSAATTEDLAADARGAWTHLRDRQDIDPERVWIVGHSEGGMIAPMVAIEEPEVAGIVLLAGPGIPIIDLMEMQHRLYARAAGATTPQADALASMYRVIYEVLNAHQERAVIYSTIQAYFDSLSETERGDLGWTRNQMNRVIESRLSPWWRYFVTFDPAAYLTRVTTPILAVNGDADLNVTAAENLRAIERAATLAGNTDCTVQEFPGLNHMLNRNDTAAADDSLALGETINRDVLELVTGWISTRAGLTRTAVLETVGGQPGVASLWPNYPNPFNGRTLIRFQLPAETQTELTIYDLTGQRVATLVRGRLAAGHHVVAWEGEDAGGRLTASGVYLIELRSGSTVLRRSLTLIR